MMLIAAQVPCRSSVCAMISAFMCLFTAAVCGSELRAVANDWEPYYGEKMSRGGPVIEAVNLILQRAGHGMKLRYYPWARALHQIKVGKADVLIATWPSAERALFLAQSEPIIFNEYGLFKRQSTPYTFSDCHKLKESNISVGSVRGYLVPECLLAAGVVIDFTVSDKLNVDRVLRQRNYLGLSDKIYLNYYLGKNFSTQRDELVWLTTLDINPLGVSFSKRLDNWPAVLNDFNLGLRQLKASGELSALFKAHGVSVPIAPDSPPGIQDNQ